MKSTLIRQQRYYMPTCFEGRLGDAIRKPEDRSPEVMLMVRDFKLWQSPKGKRRVEIKLDAVEYPNPEAMVAAIEQGGWKELSPDADGNPGYVPDDFRDDSAFAAAPTPAPEVGTQRGE